MPGDILSKEELYFIYVSSTNFAPNSYRYLFSIKGPNLLQKKIIKNKKVGIAIFVYIRLCQELSKVWVLWNVIIISGGW